MNKQIKRMLIIIIKEHMEETRDIFFSKIKNI